MASVSDVESIQKELELGWTQRMADFETRLKAASIQSSPSLTQLSTDFFAFKELITTMFTLLRQQISECTKVVDQLDMRQRQKVLLFNGITESSECNVQQEVLKTIQNTLGLSHITNTALKRCHRLGVSGQDRIRPVLVHFYDHRTKAEVWKTKSKLKGSSVSIMEFLTHTRQIVYKRARRIFGMRNVWTLDGYIHIKIPNAGRHKICMEEELDALVAKYPMGDSSPGSSACTGGSQQPNQRPHANTNRSIVPEHETRRRTPVATKHADDMKRARRVVTKK